MADVIEWSDRYGGRYPNPETICLGPCEGMGCFPVHRNESNPEYIALWKTAEKENQSQDGWHFVKCLDCNGSGRRI